MFAFARCEWALESSKSKCSLYVGTNIAVRDFDVKKYVRFILVFYVIELASGTKNNSLDNTMLPSWNTRILTFYTDFP